jgi:hypothetical protein
MFAESSSEGINKLGQEVVTVEVSYDYLLIQVKKYIPDLTMEELKRLMNARSKCNFIVDGLVKLYNEWTSECYL